jgi:hypothetical protein
VRGVPGWRCAQSWLLAPKQVERLIKIPSQNNQVGWIIGDSDVHAFYKKLLDKYAKLLKQEMWRR